jgi:SCY1-like protein 1
VTGFTDVAPVVREQTLKSVLTLITKLSDRTINGELLRYLAKTANDEQPGIRTNTTICLGKIAKNLGSSTRSKVLIAAFSRSLRDPFVHARNAALLALAVTGDYFTEEDCAARILPAICPCLIDKEKLVRDQAIKTMDVYMAKIKKAAASMPDTVLPPPTAAEHGGPRMSTPQPEFSPSGGWAGWAISSFTNKLSAAAGEIEANGTATPTPQSRPQPEAKRSAPGPITSSASALHRQALKSPPPSAPLSRTSSSTGNFGDSFFADPEPSTADDLDAWGDMDEGEESTNFQDAGDDFTTTAPKPASRTASSTATPFDDAEPDFAGWLAAQQKKPGASKGLPKGLSKPSGSVATKKPTTRPTTASKPVVTKKIDFKPKETSNDDDGWGDGW